MIIIRTLRKDIANYNREDDIVSLSTLCDMQLKRAYMASAVCATVYRTHRLFVTFI